MRTLQNHEEYLSGRDYEGSRLLFLFSLSQVQIAWVWSHVLTHVL